VERVTGIGGFFFRAKDPAALASWYEERFGVGAVPRSYDEGAWRQEEGETVFAPFPRDSEMIGPPDRTWMINFRVADLDPEGNGIQLWQPMEAEG
jgi:catechol 2,3-dioxygenase-like lactoylglutathione lyase family enzyme